MKAITTKFHGPGNVRGARISASDLDGNRVVISYNHASTEPHREAALALCRKLGWIGTLVEGQTKGGNVYVWIDSDNTFRVNAPGGRVRCDCTTPSHRGNPHRWHVDEAAVQS